MEIVNYQGKTVIYLNFKEKYVPVIYSCFMNIFLFKHKANRILRIFLTVNEAKCHNKFLLYIYSAEILRVFFVKLIAILTNLATFCMLIAVSIITKVFGKCHMLRKKFSNKRKGELYMEESPLNWSDIPNEGKDKLISHLTDNLKILRAKGNFTQENVANAIGISRQTYNAIECKKRK